MASNSPTSQQIMHTVSIESDEITFKEIIQKIKAANRYILSKWVTIIIFVLLGSVLGLLYAYLKKPVYSAATTFVLDNGDKSGGLGQYAGIASMVGVDLGGGGGGLFQGENLLELYKSRAMIQKTLLSSVPGNSTLLIDRYINFKNFRTKWAEDPELKNINFKLAKGQQFTRLQDSVLKKVVENINKNNLVVSYPDKKLSIVSVVVNAEDELFAKDFNEQIVKTVNDFYVQTKTKKNSDNVVILQHQTDSVKSVLNGAIYTSASITDATPNLNPTKQILRVPVQRSQLSAEANKVILSELVRNLELAKLSLRRETPLIQVIDTPILPLTLDRFGKVKGAILGAFIGGFLTILFLLMAKVLKQNN